MSQVVQARCPSCQHVLRIPAAWLNQTVRCTRCKAMFQTRAKEPTPSAPPTAAPSSLKATPPPPPARIPSVLPVPAPPPVPHKAPPAAVKRVAPATPFSPPPATAPETDFGFVSLSRSAPPQRGGSNWLRGGMLWLGVLLVGAALGYLAWPEISGLFLSGKSSEADKDKEKIAAVDKKDGEDPRPKPSEPPVVSDKTTPDHDKETLDKDKKGGDKASDGPAKEDDKVEPKKKEKEPVVKPAAGDFPRRALLINVSHYLLFNPLYYGQDLDTKKPGGSTGAVARRLALPPMNFPKAQVFELADGKVGGHATTKPVIEAAITDFLLTSRDQDRIVVLFTGHGIELEKEAYLVPADGNRKNPASLIKLSWVYDRLKACRARQKILILDVFRYPPARGEEIDGTGVMTEAFLEQINTPPDGVQVWASCSKDQQSLELENGSLFLQALNQSTRELAKGIARPEEAIPIEDLLPLVNKTLKTRLGKVEQVSLMTGKEGTGKAFDPEASPAAPIAFKDPASTDPKLRLAVQGILDELNLMPAIRGVRPTIPAASVLPFVTGKLKDFEADYASLKELEKTIAADAEKYPLRAAYFEAVAVLKETAKFPIKDYEASPVTDKRKAEIGELQKEQPGILDFKLKELKAKMKELHDTKRAEETSRRWLANFDYARVMVDAKIIFLNEYNYNLASLRSTDRMPELEGAGGWRLGSSRDLATKENPIKSLYKKLPAGWDKITDDYKETPWAILANRESMTAMGLEWRAAKE